MITNGAAVVGSGSAVALFWIPPGPALVQVASSGTATAVYVGITAAGGSLSAANGFPVPTGALPVAIPVYAGSAGGLLSGIASSGSATLSWLVSEPSGGT